MYMNLILSSIWAQSENRGSYLDEMGLKISIGTKWDGIAESIFDVRMVSTLKLRFILCAGD